MKLKLIFIVFFALVSCKKETKNTTETKTKEAVTETKTSEALEIYDFNGLEKFLNFKDDKTYVVNFWATWCAPCVKELPYFEQLNEAYNDKNVEVLLVSLDFPHQYDTKLKPFIKEHKLKSKVLVLDDADMNTWIPKVDENWSGSIPATVIYNKNKKLFFEQSFSFEELENELKPFLN
ncbi:TlpA family protein disulfide reductase [Tamlana sp. 62-3]|uniref:TlpA family protein disulfide reductase n=1 Tax=Neotamlana sargassicola TaxID=2883125 RepID=A0A9X1L7V6_9FLAO|nr:TlpA disulfide reductase family protein [Tamlana sargassicola]MCB4808158.1 TlpA family protein disulfide reductase [Tamlana sargassicola]